MSSTVTQIAADPVFDRCWWIYSLCRERLFADHTDTIADALQPLLKSHSQLQLLEVGCGPGFYSRRLAARFPGVHAMGVDTSERLLSRARFQAHREKLDNCHFLKADAHSLHTCLHAADAAIASRFFLILPDREQVLQAVFETLRPGGVFFIAEPVSRLRTAIPLWAMRAVEWLAGQRGQSEVPTRCEVLSPDAFKSMVHGQPWSAVRTWRDKRYQYALCEKAS